MATSFKLHMGTPKHAMHDMAKQVVANLTLSHPIALCVEYLRGPIDFRIAQHVWDDQIHLKNTH